MKNRKCLRIYSGDIFIVSRRKEQPERQINSDALRDERTYFGSLMYAMLEVLMKVLVFYRPHSEHARAVEEFVRDLQRRHDIDEQHLVIYDIDTRDGSAMASLYDVMSYPSFFVVGDDGAYIKGWNDGALPRMDEIVSYTFAF